MACQMTAIPAARSARHTISPSEPLRAEVGRSVVMVPCLLEDDDSQPALRRRDCIMISKRYRRVKENRRSGPRCRPESSSRGILLVAVKAVETGAVRLDVVSQVVVTGPAIHALEGLPRPESRVE